MIKAFYSQEAADLHGTVYWLIDGVKYELTGICDDSGYLWPDKVELCDITDETERKFLGPGVDGQWSEIDRTIDDMAAEDYEDELDYYDRFDDEDSFIDDEWLGFKLHDNMN